MKTLSATFRLLVAVAIGVASLLTFRAFAKKPNSIAEAPYVLNMKGRHLKNPDKDAFKKLLDDNEAIYCITHRKNDSDPGSKLDNGGCTTQSATSVDDASRDMLLVCGGAHVTQQAAFNTTLQMQAVSNELLP